MANPKSKQKAKSKGIKRTKPQSKHTVVGKAKSLTLFNDPIHRIMVFEEKNKTDEEKLRKIFRNLCDHEYFQRLRHIKQLGCSDLVFPGAVHTRFNHCLGVCYLAKRIADKIDLGPEQKKMVMIAALLHDIGHGPFSHAFEKLYGKKNKIKHDDQWIRMFLKNYNENPLNSKLFRDNVESLITSSDEIKKKIPSELVLLRDILSSNLDADRLDYLLRDSHFCGVPYGKIDLEWILSCVTRITTGKSKKDDRLGINRKGIGAIEDFLCARRLMTRNIYYHGKVKAAEYYIYYFMRDLALQLNNNKSAIIKSLPEIKDSNLGKFLILTTFLINDERKYSEKVINTYLSKSFKYYSKLTDNDIWTAARQIANLKSKGDCEEIARRLVTRRLPDSYALNPSRFDYAKQIQAEISKKYKLREWQVYIEDFDMVSYKHEKSPILIEEISGGYSNIFHESTLLNFLSDKKEYTDFIYIAKDINIKARKELIRTLDVVNQT